MSQGNGSYNRAHDAEMFRQTQQAEALRRRQEHQTWLAGLTPEERAAYEADRQRQLRQGRREARIWAETTLRSRNRQNVVSDEDELEQQQQTGGGRRRQKRNTRKTKRTRKHKKTHRLRK